MNVNEMTHNYIFCHFGFCSVVTLSFLPPCLIKMLRFFFFFFLFFYQPKIKVLPHRLVASVIAFDKKMKNKQSIYGANTQQIIIYNYYVI